MKIIEAKEARRIATDYLESNVEENLCRLLNKCYVEIGIASKEGLLHTQFVDSRFQNQRLFSTIYLKLKEQGYRIEHYCGREGVKISW